jgi:thioredoxin 1
MKKWIAAVLLLMSAMTVPPNYSSDIDTSKADKKQTNVPSVGKKVTFIELGSVKCIPCKMMQLIMKEIKKEYGEEVEMVFYDVRTKIGRPVGEKYRIRMIPTQILLDEEGKEFFRHEGYFPKDEIVKVLKTRGVGGRSGL